MSDKILVKRLTETAMLPTRGSGLSSGLDLYADESVTVHGLRATKIRTGIAATPPPGCELQIRPRSSLSAAGLMCHFGTIDADYTGELLVLLQGIASPYERRIERGDRIAQLVCAPIRMASPVIVDELPNLSDRGDGGFGSTGR